jgi:hypothetical protein
MLRGIMAERLLVRAVIGARSVALVEPWILQRGADGESAGGIMGWSQ